MKGQDVRRRLRQRGRSQRELAAYLSRQLGRSISNKSVSRLVNEDRRISADEAAAIEQFFGPDDAFEAPMDRTAAPPRLTKIPRYGLAAAAPGVIAYDADTILDWIDAPILYVDAAFRVADFAMEPRLYAGETVYVKLGVAPVRGGDCVVELKGEPPGVIVRTFVQTKDGWVFLKQWNPESEIKLHYDKVRALHAVRLRS